MGRVHDMVTGLLNGNSSMIPLFFKSRGVGFAVENKTKHSTKVIVLAKHTINNADFVGDLTPTMAIKRNQNQSFHISENFAVKNSHFLLGLRLRLMGGGVTSLRRLGR